MEKPLIIPPYMPPVDKVWPPPSFTQKPEEPDAETLEYSIHVAEVLGDDRDESHDGDDENESLDYHTRRLLEYRKRTRGERPNGILLGDSEYVRLA